MSVDSVLDGAFTILLAKAQRRQLEAGRTTRSATVNFMWGGGGSPIAVALDAVTNVSTPTFLDPLLAEVPFPSSIQWAHVYAGDGAGHPIAVNTTIDVQLTQLLTFGSSVPLNGTGTAPRLQADSSTDVDLTDWQTNLMTGDALIARVTSLTGVPTWIALVLLLRPTDEALGVIDVTNNAGDPMTNSAGDPMVFRN